MRAPLTTAAAAWKSLPTDSEIERETDLVPQWIAESVLQAASVYLQTDLPDEWTERLTAKAERCFAGHRQFRRLISSNRNHGNAGRDKLQQFMRHWLASLLHRHRHALRRQLPWSYALGFALPRRTP